MCVHAHTRARDGHYAISKNSFHSLVMTITHLQRSTLDFLYADHVEGEDVVQQTYSLDHHVGEELLLVSYHLGVQGSGGTIHKQVLLLSACAWTQS